MIKTDALAEVREHGTVERRRFEKTFVKRHGNQTLNVMAISRPNPRGQRELAWLKAQLACITNPAVYTAFQAVWRPFTDRNSRIHPAVFEWLVAPLAVHPDYPVEICFNMANRRTFGGKRI